jgi:hypothetical protein
VNNDWLTASSFERVSEITSAINTLSINAKLRLACLKDPADPAQVGRAKIRLVAFLGELQKLIDSVGKQQGEVIVGADPRLGELTIQYLAEQRRLPPRAELFTLSLPQLVVLIESDSDDDLSKRVECLESLRSILEQHAHADVAGMFGDE